MSTDQPQLPRSPDTPESAQMGPKRRRYTTLWIVAVSAVVLLISRSEIAVYGTSAPPQSTTTTIQATTTTTIAPSITTIVPTITTNVPPTTATQMPATTTTTVASTGWQPVGIPGNWTTKFDDEFTGSSVDASKWTANWLGAPGAITPPVNGYEPECYDPKQATVANGELDLTAIASSCTAGGQTYSYRSGMIQSNGRFNFTHGALEARIWTPAGTGMWPAFWTDGQSWPTDGEIDVLEGNGTNKSGYHYSCGGGCGPGGTAVVSGATSGWHIYSANWQSGTITWYHDGVPVFSYPTQTNSPMYLILNLGLNSTSSAVPAKMRVDYVRVWQ